MREIEFRGKRKDNGKWVQGLLMPHCLIEDPDYLVDYWIATGHEDEQFPVVSETVGQYTGLKDRNGVKIFEGDIVRHKGFGVKQATWGSDYDSLSKCCGFMWNGTIAFLSTNETDRCEVIGNIHDNPELLKETCNA